MNWCKPHWNKLREVIADSGLEKFGAKDGQEAASEIASQLEGGKEKFDPLLGSWMRINAYMADSLKRQGRAHELLMLRCPCCILVEDGQPELVEKWITGCVTDAFNYAVKEGLVSEH